MFKQNRKSRTKALDTDSAFREALLSKLEFSSLSSDRSESHLGFDSVKERIELESIRIDQCKFKKEISNLRNDFALLKQCK